MQTFKAHRGEIRTLAFSVDGGTLLSACMYEVGLWSVPGGTAAEPFDGRPVSGLCSVLRRDGRLDVVGDPGNVVVLAVGRGDEYQVVERPFSVVGNDRVFAFIGGEVVQWDAGTGEELARGWGGTRESNNGRKFPIGALAIHPTTGQLAMTCGVRSAVRRGEWESGVEFFDAETGESQRLLRAPFTFDHITRIQFTPDGDFLIGASGPRWRAWRVETGEEVASGQPTRKHILDLTLTADGNRFVTVGNDSLVRVWNVANWSEAGGFEWDIGPLTSVASSPDGCLLAAGSKRGRVVVWDDVP